LLMVSFSRSQPMQRFVFLCALCASGTSAGSVRGSRSVSTSGSLERPHGFADADTDSDVSFKVLNKKKMHGRHSDNHSEVRRSSGSRRSREIQHQIEQMVSRVKQLNDEEASVAFANELDDIEEELSSSTADKALAQEVDKVRADLCTQQNLMDVGLDKCESFMDKSCSKRPLKVPSHFCTRFFRLQKRKERSGSSTKPNDEAVKFTANTVSAETKVGTEGAAEVEGDSASAGEIEVEQTAHAPGPAAAGPAPGPVPMGPYFGGKAVRPLPEQGFEGKLEQPYKSEDQMVQNWQREFGPNAGHRSFENICADFKNNEWCRLHGYYDSTASKTVIEEIVEKVESAGGSESGSGNKSGAEHHSFIAILAVGVVSGLTWF